MNKILLFMMMAAGVAQVLAAQKTATLAVAGMSCEACPITVKKALTKVNGVSRAVVDFDKRLVVVDFDDAKTSVQQLILATSQAGYPSTIRENRQ